MSYLTEYDDYDISSPAFEVEKAVIDTAFSSVARCLLVESDGRALIVTEKNTEIEVPLLRGYNPIRCKMVKTLDGGLSDVWGLL